jgi:hypothetical protein
MKLAFSVGVLKNRGLDECACAEGRRRGRGVGAYSTSKSAVTRSIGAFRERGSNGAV